MSDTPGQFYKKHGAKAFKKKSEEHFSSHRELPNGRNFMMWNKAHDPEAERKYKDNFANIFPNSPGSEY